MYRLRNGKGRHAVVCSQTRISPVDILTKHVLSDDVKQGGQPGVLPDFADNCFQTHNFRSLRVQFVSLKLASDQRPSLVDNVRLK